MKKQFALISSVLLFSACTTVGPDGKQHIDTAKTAAMGATIGGLLGCVATDCSAKNVAIGAALGGGAGYVGALEFRKRELAYVEQENAAITRETGFKPVVYKEQYVEQVPASTPGQQAGVVDGLKVSTFNIPVKEAVKSKNELSTKAVVTLTRLSSAAQKTGGKILVAVPNHCGEGVMRDIKTACPSAIITKSASADNLAVSITAAPVPGGAQV